MFFDQDPFLPGRNVIVFANCHGWVVRLALKAYAPDFNSQSRVHYIPNYTDDHERFLDEAAHCDLFLFQTEKGEHIQRRFEALKARLPATTPIVRFPMIGFNVVWPTAYQDYAAPIDPAISAAMYPFGDRAIVGLVKKGLSPEKAVDQFLESPPFEGVQLTRALELWQASTQAQEAQCDVSVTDIILDNVFERQTFYWPTHCANFVIFTMVDRILAQVQRSPLLPSAGDAANALHDWEIPLHPLVREHFGIKFATPRTSYLLPNKSALPIRDYYLAYIEYLRSRHPEHFSSVTST